MPNESRLFPRRKLKTSTQRDKSEGEWHAEHRHGFSVCLEKQWRMKRDIQGMVPNLALISTPADSRPPAPAKTAQPSVWSPSILRNEMDLLTFAFRRCVEKETANAQYC